MFTNRTKALFLGLIAAGLLLSFGAGAARADEKPAGEDAAEAKGIAWVDGWAAGQARAKEDGKLIFLYFGRHVPR